MKRMLVLFLLLAGNAMASPFGPTPNPYPAYPASCVSYPLNESPTTPSVTAQVLLPTYNFGSHTTAGTETVTFNLWRIPCDGGRSALLGQIIRSDANNGRTDVAPEFPQILTTQTQNSITNRITRVANEPNTYASYIAPGTPIVQTQDFIFENNGPTVPTNIDWNGALTVNLVAANTSNTPLSVVAYKTTDYPTTAGQPLAIAGYLTSAWYDPTHSGEGMEIQVYDTPDSSTRTFLAAWYTFDTTGRPFWLSAQLSYSISQSTGLPTTSLAGVPASYVTGGGFAGNFGAKANTVSWGTMTFTFPDCNTMTFTYTGATGADAPNGPSGNGTRTWKRLATVNNNTCD